MRPFLALLLTAAHVLAVETLPEDRGPAALWQSLKRLQTPARVLYVTAHPDDEDPALLTYLSRGLGLQVTMLVLNRGEGGANVVSGDFFEALGALRTVEMLRAAQAYGVEVRFTRAVDYGYSKTIDEAFRSWNQNDLLADVVAITRQVKPHIVISRFNDSARDGHGHHQAAGRLAKLAFAAAPAGAWRPLKLYTGNWREGEAVTLKIDTGAYDPLLGRSYAQIGRDGYRWHRSQGMAANVARPGPVYSYLKREDSSQPETSLLDGISLPAPSPQVLAAAKAFDALHPERCAPYLAQAIQSAPPQDPSLPELSRALALSLGLEFEALVEPDNPPTGPFALFRPIETITVAQPGQPFKARLTLHQRGAERVDSVEYGLQGPFLATQGTEAGTFAVQVLENAPPTVAAWSRASVRDSFYRLSDPAHAGLPLPQSAIGAVAHFTYRGARATLRSELESTSGAVRQPLVIAPPVSVQFDSACGFARLGQKEYQVAVTVTNFSPGPVAGQLRLSLPSVPPQSFQFSKTGDRAKLTFRFPLPENLGAISIGATATVAGRSYDSSFEPIRQPGLRVAYLGRPAAHALRAADLRYSPDLRVGYIMGSGDEVPEALRQFGIPVTLLDANALASADLSRFSAILVGIRAYAVREDLKAHNQRLIDYAKAGGNVVVQYQTQEYDRNYAAFPYSQGRGAEEVSEEDAPVTLLEPNHPAFQRPNRITPADFSGWVEQRGSKFFTTWDAAWTPLLETHDQEQAPQKGVCLVSQPGKGFYSYCSLAFYRQLPFAVPGAARLLVNLLSLNSVSSGGAKP
jgi:LmbE family N-acetylglucosaminyl deacetylase